MIVGPRNPNFTSVSDRYPGLSKEEAYRQNRIDWRKKYLLNQENHKKNLARQTVRNAIRDGKLIKKECEICGDPNSEAHHIDYDKPLDVTWLCRRHHLEQH